MNWQEYHFKYFKNYFEPAGILTCPSVLPYFKNYFEPAGTLTYPSVLQTKLMQNGITS